MIQRICLCGISFFMFDLKCGKWNSKRDTDFDKVECLFIISVNIMVIV